MQREPPFVIWIANDCARMVCIRDPLPPSWVSDDREWDSLRASATGRSGLYQGTFDPCRSGNLCLSPDIEEALVRREATLPPDASAPPKARALLDEVLPPLFVNGRADDARLVLTEIVANAVRHADWNARPGKILLRFDTDDA